MAMNERLVEINNKRAEAYLKNDMVEYKRLFEEEYLEQFQWCAIHDGDGVIGYEDPTDYIMEGLYYGEEPKENFLPAIKEMAQMVKALKDCGYLYVGEWEKNYHKCLEAYAGTYEWN